MDDVIRAARAFRAGLIRREQEQMREMVRQWRQVEETLRDQMVLLAWKIKEYPERVSLHDLYRLERYQRLLGQTRAELERYAQWCGGMVADGQTEMVRLGLEHAQQLTALSAERAGITARIDALPMEAVEGMVGTSADGTALGTLLQRGFFEEGGLPNGWMKLQTTLVRGVALGQHPEKTAAQMAQHLLGGLNRAFVIARTEQTRVYREASLAQWDATGIVSGHKRLVGHDDRVCAACLADEGHVYRLVEMLWSHPQCRCTSVPVLMGAAEPEWELGEEWLRKQSKARQDLILGSKAAGDAFRSGTGLSDFTRKTDEGPWGITIRAMNPVKLMTYPGHVSQPPLAVSTQSGVSLNPMGEMVSNHIRIPTSGVYRKAYQHALALVDQVHGDGPLPEVKLSTESRNFDKDTYGLFRVNQAGWFIQVNGKHSPHIESTVLHEIGHWIDYGGLGSKQRIAGSISERNGLMRKFWEAVIQSDEIRELMVLAKANPRDRFVGYLLDPAEIWARAYAQYIGEKTQNAEILATMESIKHESGNYHLSQWESGRFQPIREAIDEVMEAKGWIRKN